MSISKNMLVKPAINMADKERLGNLDLLMEHIKKLRAKIKTITPMNQKGLILDKNKKTDFSMDWNCLLHRMVL